VAVFFDSGSFSVAPEQQGQDAGFCFSGGDGMAETAACIVREGLAEDTEDHVIDLQNAIGVLSAAFSGGSNPPGSTAMRRVRECFMVPCQNPLSKHTGHERLSYRNKPGGTMS
jgi:hypothetical protein